MADEAFDDFEEPKPDEDSIQNTKPEVEFNEAAEADSALDKIGKNIKQLKYGDLSA